MAANHRKWLGYALFVVILSGFFLYFCFPSEAICRYVTGSATRLAPSVAFSVEKIRPAFPCGLRLEDTGLSLRARPDMALFEADTFVIRPSARVLALRKPAFRFDCQGVYGGEIEGVVAFETFSLQGPVESDIEIRRVQLDHYPNFGKWLNMEFTGVMNGAIVYVFTQGDLLRGSGEGDVTIQDSTIRFAQPFLGMESVHFDQIDASMALEKSRISVTHCDFMGDQLQGTVSGTIDLRDSFHESTLDLIVSLESFSALSDDPGLFDVAGLFSQGMREGNLTIYIRGTVSQPRISFT